MQINTVHQVFDTVSRQRYSIEVSAGIADLCPHDKHAYKDRSRYSDSNSTIVIDWVLTFSLHRFFHPRSRACLRHSRSLGSQMPYRPPRCPLISTLNPMIVSHFIRAANKAPLRSKPMGLPAAQRKTKTSNAQIPPDPAETHTILHQPPESRKYVNFPFFP